MAQDLTIAGATYENVPSVEIPKSGGGTASFVDTTDADAVANEIDMGKTAYVNGVKLTGTRSGGGGSYTAGDGIDITNDVISLDVASANDIGGIKVGSGLSIDVNGVLSAIGGVQEEEIWSGTLTTGYATLSKPISDYDFINIYFSASGWGALDSIPYIFSAQSLVDKISTGTASFYGYDQEYCGFVVNSATQISIASRKTLLISKITGLKIGGGSSALASQIASLEARIQALESQLS